MSCRLQFPDEEERMDASNRSIGSDGERSEERSSPNSPTESEKSLKFSIANILRPEFGAGPPSPPASPASPPLPSPSSTTTPSALQVAAATLGLAAAATAAAKPPVIWPAWVYCTRYSDRPSSGPRCRKVKRKTPAAAPAVAPVSSASAVDEKRPRTAFTTEQLGRLKAEFQENRYLTEKRRQELAHQLGLNESQIKIWFQNKRAKMKKQCGIRNPLAYALMSQGLYNHATVPLDGEEECKEEMD